MASEISGTVKTGMVDVREGDYERQWNIQNFDLIYPKNDLLENEKFEFQTTQGENENCTWIIGLQKEVANSSEFLNMTFRLYKTNGYNAPEVQASLKAGMIGVDGKSLWEQAINVSMKEGEIKAIGVCHISKEYKDCLLSTAFQPDRSVTFLVKIVLARHIGTRYMVPDPTNELKQLETRSTTILLGNLAKLLGDEDSSDIKIITSDDVTLHAHKFVLKMQNPVFASMLPSDLSESRLGFVRVNEICGKTMEIILCYLYTGKLQPGWCDADTISEFTYAAGKYQLTEVLKMLDNMLGSEYKDEYAHQYVSLLSLANKLSLTNAEQRLRKRITEATAKAKTTEELFAIFSAQTEIDATAYSSNEGTTVNRQLDGE